MKRSALWRQFPVYYVVPFLLSTIEIERLATASEILRWLAMGLGILLYMLHKKSRGFRKMNSLLMPDVVALGFLFLFALSSFWSIDPDYTLKRTISLWLLYGCSFWTFWIYADQYSEDLLLRKILLTIAVVMIINLLMTPFILSAFTRGRFSGLFVNPNNIGLLTGICVPLAFSLWLRTRQRIYMLAFIVPLVSLAAAGTRSALLGVFIAITLIVASIFRRRPVRAISIAIIAIISVLLFSQTQYFIDNVLREESLQTGSNRIFFWGLAKEYIAHRPELGHGFGTDGKIHQYYGFHLTALGLRGYGVMSSYYGLAVQVGWVATFAFFGLLWMLALRCVIAHWRDLQLVTLGATLISGLTICVFEPAIYSAGNAFSFLFWICVMLAVRRLSYKRKRVRLDTRGRLVTKQYANKRRNPSQLRGKFPR